MKGRTKYGHGNWSLLPHRNAGLTEKQEYLSCMCRRLQEESVAMIAGAELKGRTPNGKDVYFVGAGCYKKWGGRGKREGGAPGRS